MNAKYPLRISSKIMISEYIMTTTIIFYKQRFINMPKTQTQLTLVNYALFRVQKQNRKKRNGK